MAACTLFSKHKERDVYTKACGAEELCYNNGLELEDVVNDLSAGLLGNTDWIVML